MIVTEKKQVIDFYSFHLEPRGFNVISYQNPIKAMDNLDEINPDLVLFSAGDFPRHWKIFQKYYEEVERINKGVFILLKGQDFDKDEHDKAKILAVNGIINEVFHSPSELNDLEDILSLNNMIQDDRNSPRFIPDKEAEINFIFTHPDSFKIISGKVSDISIYGLAFQADNPDLTEDLLLEQSLPMCSLNLGEAVLPATCFVKRNSRLLGLSFEDGQDLLKRAIQEFVRESSKKRFERRLESV